MGFPDKVLNRLVCQMSAATKCVGSSHLTALVGHILRPQDTRNWVI